MMTMCVFSYHFSYLYFFQRNCDHLDLHSFPTRRSSDLKTVTPRVINAPDAMAGLDVKYAVTQGLSADFTLKTDFAQVEADEQQVNLRSEEHTSELQSQSNLVCRLLLEKKK